MLRALLIFLLIWLNYAVLVIHSLIASTSGQENDGYGANDLFSAEVELTVITGELNPTVEVTDDVSNDSKSALRHMDAIQKELALCSATLMAVETRETMLKEQFMEYQTVAIEPSNYKSKMESLEYVQRIQQLERSLQEEREQMQRKLSRYTLMMNQYQEELLWTNQLLRMQNENCRQQIVQVQDELFTVRYEYHQFNEAQRHTQMSFHRWYDALRNQVLIPLLDWLLDPCWDRFIYPHVVDPLRKSAEQTCYVAREYFDQNFSILRRHAEARRPFVSQEYIESVSKWMQRFLQTNPQAIKIWILVGEVSEKSRKWFRVGVTPNLLAAVEWLRIRFRWAYVELSDIVFIVESRLQQLCQSKWNICYGTGLHIAIYNVAFSIFKAAVLQMDGNESWIMVTAVLLLVCLTRQRRRRYLE